MLVLPSLLCYLLAAGVVAAWVARGRTTTFLVALYVAAYALIVGTSMMLSLFNALGRAGYVAAAVVVAVAAVFAGVWRRPPEPTVRRTAATLRHSCGDPVVAGLGLVGALSLGYATALGLFTVANDQDVTTYHLTRAAAWLQQGHVGHVEFIEDPRVSGFPPAAETISSFLIATSGSDRFVALPQLAAVGCLIAGAIAVARHVGFTPRQALFGALCIPTFPIVAYQTQSALNDLPVAALLVAAVALAFTRTTPAFALSSVALAAALFTKLSAIVALPVIVPIVVMIWWPRWKALLLWLACACAPFAAWSLMNVAKTSRPAGGEFGGHTGQAEIAPTVARVIRVLLSTIDVPGAVGRDRALFALAGAVLAVVGVLGTRRRDAAARGRLAPIAAGLIVAATPLLIVLVDGLQKAQWKAWRALDQDHIARIRAEDAPAIAEQNSVGIGPAALITGLIAIAVVVATAKREGVLGWRRLPLPVLLVVAPVVSLVTSGVLLGYNPWLVRMSLAALALGAATWGVVLAYRPVAYAVPVMAAVVSLLAWTHFEEKPSGWRLLEPRDRGTSAFQLDRTALLADRVGIEPVLRFADDKVPVDAAVAVWPAEFPNGDSFEDAPDLVPFALWGPRFERTVVQARGFVSAEQQGADWYLAPTRSLTGCTPGWRERYVSQTGWTVLERSPGDRSTCEALEAAG